MWWTSWEYLFLFWSTKHINERALQAQYRKIKRKLRNGKGLDSTARSPSTGQALPFSAAKLQQAEIERVGPACSNAKVFHPLSPLSVHVRFWWIRIGTCVHLVLSTWLNASLNWSLKSWRNLVFTFWVMSMQMAALLLMNDCSPFSQNGVKMFLVHSIFFQLSVFFMCLRYLPKSLLQKCVLLVIGSLNLSCSPQYVYFLACVGVADLSNLDAPSANCG